MKAKLRDTDSYLGEWRKVALGEVSDDLQIEASKKAAELEAEFDRGEADGLGSMPAGRQRKRCTPFASGRCGMPAA